MIMTGDTMDICLINPPLDKQTTSKFPMSGVPVGIAQLAGFLRDNGVEVSAIDAVIERYTPERTARAVEKLGPMIVGITCLTENRYSAVKTARAIKERLPDVFIVFGGLHPSVTDKLMLRNYPSIDMIIRGEGEYALLELIQAVKNKKSPYSVQGSSFMRNNEFYSLPCKKFIKDLDKLPFPAYDLFPMDRYENPPDLEGDGIKSTPISASRGCPMGCLFCATTKYWGRTVRTMSNKKLIEEIKWLNSEYGINYIRFVDDLFTMKRERVMDFCRLMLKEKLDIGYRLQSRIDTVNKEMLALLKKIGTDTIEYGVESGSDRILKMMGKGITTSQISDAIRKTKDAGIIAKYFLIVGNLGEREPDTWATFKLIKESRPDWVAVNPLTIYPGTEIYEIAKAKGLVSEDVWLNYVNPKTGNAPLFAEYYRPKEMIFISHLARLWCAKHSRFGPEHRTLERLGGAMLNERTLKKLIYSRAFRRSATSASSLLWPFLP